MKVNLIGKANGWENAPQENAWGVHSVCLRRDVDMVFDMHKIYEEPLKSDPEQIAIIDYVNKNKVPLVTLKKLDYIPTSIEFPLDKMPLKYCECSIAYMIFYALLEGVTEIDMYGFLMADYDVYNKQLKSVEYWIGYARGKGIKVTIHEPTAICKGRQGLYGYEYQ